MSDEKNINEMIQLIYYDLSFNENFAQFINSSGIHSGEKDYNTVAIIGCQSSGKSTLLNNLFNTKFEVMVEEQQRGQTTKGIWVALSKKFKMMILDCEGTDSKERGEDRYKFEHCSSLFALAMADLLIINMWSNNVGRHTASNYGVLKTVFEMNLKLFQQECAKKILIVLRDFDEPDEVRNAIFELILKDIFNIWKDIKKPEKYKDYTPDKFFQFEFVTLPHKYYFEEKFLEEVSEMRKRLSPNSNIYLFDHVAKEKIVPIDGLSIYSRQIWSDIISNKDLNIPSQKEMLANYRCNEIKDMALQQCEIDLESFQMDSAAKILDNFKERSEKITKQVLSNYDETAKNYIKHVYEEIRRHLLLQLSQKMYVCFDNQAKKFILIFQKNMRHELEKDLKNNDNFFECAVKIKKDYLTFLVKQLDSIRYFDNWEISINQYEELFDEIIDSQRKYSLVTKKSDTIKKLKSLMEDSLIESLEELSPDFWSNFNNDYVTHFNSILFALKDYLREYYKMEENEYIPFVRDIENEVFSAIKKDLYKKSREISNYAVESFRKHFWYDEGIPRVWNKIDESEIDSLFTKYKNENLFVFDIFKKFKLLMNPLNFFNYQKPTEESFNNFSSNLKKILEDQSINYEPLMTDNDFKTIKSKYEDNISNILEDAKRRHANVIKQSIPIWVWILIIYLGYEDILKYSTSLWVIIPLILCVTVYGSLHALGMGHVPNHIFSLVKYSLTASFKKE